jgi:arylsulfatase A-like enzyme
MPMTRRGFLQRSAAAAVLGAIPAWANASPPRSRPNVVFLLADDLGWSDLACYGNTFHETPRIDALARSGLRFTHAYAACAVCSPTRASILTGKYPVRLGITDWIPGEDHPEAPLALRHTRNEMPLEEVTLAETLRTAGYRTAFVGKWHLGGERFYPENQGFDVNVGGCEAGQPPSGYFSRYKNPRLSDGPPGEYLPDRLASESIKLLEGFAKDRSRPFLLYHAFYLVHMPLQPRPDLKQKFEAKKTASPDARWTNTSYAAMTAALDEHVGRILDALDRLGLADNTIVVFTSDNGGVDYSRVTSNYPLRAGKGRYYEGGIRVPMIVRGPGIATAGTTCGVRVLSTDHYPTLLSMAGLPLVPGQHRDGLDLAPLLRSGKAPSRDALFWHYPHYHGSGATPCSTVLAGPHKLIRFYETGVRELYDLEADPSETTNLAARAPEKVRALEERLDGWLAETGAVVPTRA